MCDALALARFADKDIQHCEMFAQKLAQSRGIGGGGGFQFPSAAGAPDPAAAQQNDPGEDDEDWLYD